MIVAEWSVPGNQKISIAFSMTILFPKCGCPRSALMHHACSYFLTDCYTLILFCLGCDIFLLARVEPHCPMYHLAVQYVRSVHDLASSALRASVGCHTSQSMTRGQPGTINLSKSGRRTCTVRHSVGLDTCK